MVDIVVVVVGCWLLVVGCWCGYWSLVWLLVVGCWLLVVGCWLVAAAADLKMMTSRRAT